MRIWKSKTYHKPGEYGSAKTGVEGFTIVTHPKLNGQKIFISSLTFVDGLAREQHIPNNCIVNLIPIPEVKLAPEKGLQLFRTHLAELHKHTDQKNILIHCLRGRNRSPIGTLIYMVDRGIPYDEAYTAIMTAMKVRFPYFVFNPYDNYTWPLQRLEYQSICSNYSTHHQGMLACGT